MCFFILFYLYLIMSKKIANTQNLCISIVYSSVALTNVGITLCHTCTKTFFQKTYFNKTYLLMLKRIQSVIIDFIVSFDDTTSFCFALNKLCYLNGIVQYCQSCIVKSLWYPDHGTINLLYGFIASLATKIISKEKMINIKRSKCS